MPDEHEIGELAYYLWISEGKPVGQAERHWQIATKIAADQKNGRAAARRSIDPSEAKGTTEPEQPDQT